MSLYQGDRAPKVVPFTVLNPPAGVAAVTLAVRRPFTRNTREWSTQDLVISSDELTFDHALAADGSDLEDSGRYYYRVWMYDAVGGLLETTEEVSFVVLPQKVTWPEGGAPDDPYVSFAAYSLVGALLPGLTPTWATYRDVLTGVVASSPSIDGLGDGLYSTQVPAGKTGVIDLGVTAEPRWLFVAGRLTGIVTFPAWSTTTGGPLAGLTPVMASYRNAATGASLASPVVFEVGGGIYRVAVASAATGIVDLGGTASPQYVQVDGSDISQ